MEWIVLICEAEAELGEPGFEFLDGPPVDFIRQGKVLLARIRHQLHPSFKVADKGESELDALRHFIIQPRLYHLRVHRPVLQLIGALQLIVGLIMLFQELLG